jgi:hypothetical protein
MKIHEGSTNPLGLDLSSHEVAGVLPKDLKQRLSILKGQELGDMEVALSAMPFASGILLESLGVISQQRTWGILDEAPTLEVTNFGQEVVDILGGTPAKASVEPPMHHPV